MKMNTKKKSKILFIVVLTVSVIALLPLKIQNEDISSEIVDENLNTLIETTEEMSNVNKLTGTGTRIGIAGASNGTNSGNMLGGWTLGGGGYWISTSYQSDFPTLGADFTGINDWQYQKSIIDINNLIDDNDFFWNYDFTTDNWTATDTLVSPAPPTGTGITCAEAKLFVPAAGKQWEGQNVGGVHLHENDRDLVVQLSDSDWTTVTRTGGDGYTHVQESRWWDEHDTYTYNYVSCRNVGPDPETLVAFAGTSCSSARSISGVTDNHIEIDTDVNTDFYIINTETPEEPGQNEFAGAYLKFEDHRDEEYTGVMQFSYTSDGSVPDSVSFTATASTSRPVIVNQETGSEYSYSRKAWVSIDLMVPTVGTYNIYQENNVDTLTEAISKSVFASYFTATGTYELRITISTDIKQKCDGVTDTDTTTDYGNSVGYPSNAVATLDDGGDIKSDYTVRISNPVLTIKEERAYPSSQRVAIDADPIDFKYRHVVTGSNPQITVDCFRPSNAILVPNDDDSTFDGYAGIWVHYDYNNGTHRYESITKDLDLFSGVTQITLDLTPWMLNKSYQVNVELGVYFGSVFELEYGSEKTAIEDSSVYFNNLEFNARSVVRGDDVDMRIAWKNGVGGSEAGNKKLSTYLTDSYGSLSGEMTSAELPIDGVASPYIYFKSTSTNISFSYTHTIVLTFEDWTHTTTYIADSSSSEVIFTVNYYWNVPQFAYYEVDYSTTFYYNLFLPRFVGSDGEPYWDVEEVHYNSSETKHKFEWGSEDMGESKNDFIISYENTTYPGEANTQTATCYNAFLNDHFMFAEYSQTWDVNFSIPNAVVDITLDNDDGFSTPDSEFFPAEYVNAKSTLTSEISSGNSGCFWLNNSGGRQDIRHQTETVLAATVDYTESDTKAWLIPASASIGSEYYAGINYSDSRVIKFGVSAGIYKMGFKTSVFSVIRNTTIDWITITPSKIYNTLTHGAGDTPINISIRWIDKDTLVGITGGDVRISIAQVEVEEIGENKTHKVPTPWAYKSMSDLGDGVYSILAWPKFKGNESGNIDWGYHNFTVYCSKSGYKSRQGQDDFQIMVDTILLITDPSHGTKEPITEHPHYISSAPMDGKDSPTIISLYYQTNLTSPQYLANTAGYFYNKRVYINYTCLNLTSPASSLWNFSWNERVFADNNTGNPANGSFISGDPKWSAVLYFPKLSEPEFQNCPDYKDGIVFEYNITAWVEFNNTWPTPLDDPWAYQPNVVGNQSCENEDSVPPWIHTGPGYLAKEETIRIKLIKPETGNYTSITLLNNVTEDGAPYNMGFYNKTYEDPPLSNYWIEEHKIKQYYYNSSTISGIPVNKFRLRLLYNCTEHNNTDIAPPCGPLPEDNWFQGVEAKLPWFGKTTINLVGWNQIYNLTADNSYNWTAEVNHTISVGVPGTPINISGPTYVTPWLYFNQLTPGTYEITFSCDKNGFIRPDPGKLILSVEILDQETMLTNHTGGLVDRTDDDNPVPNPAEPIRITIPYLNQYEFNVSWEDITNWATEGERLAITGGTIECLYDDKGGAFTGNNSVAGPTWYWYDNGDGNYTIKILNTVESWISDLPFEVRYRITRGNYSTIVFSLYLKVRPRNITINFISADDIGVYSTASDYKTFRQVWFVYAILDLDNNSKHIDFSTIQIKNYFHFEYTNESYDFSISELDIVKMDLGGGVIRYNVTIDTHDDPENPGDVFPFGLCGLNFTFSGMSMYYSAYNFTNFEIQNSNMLISIKSGDFDNIVQFIHHSYGIAEYRAYANVPWYGLKFTDINHSVVQSNYPVSYTGISINCNYTAPTFNRYYNTPNSINASSTVYEDFYVDTSYYIEIGEIKLIVDVRNMSTTSQPYFLNLTFSKTYYNDAYLILNLTIINATTRFSGDKIYLNYKETAPDIDTPSDLLAFPNVDISSYIEGDHKIVPWNKYIGIRFTYQTVLDGIAIDDSTIPGSQAIYCSIENLGFTGWTIAYQYRDLDEGRHYLLIQADIANESSFNGDFNIRIWTDNYNPVIFKVNITIRDRYTLLTPISSDISVIWTFPGSVTVSFEDSDYYPAGEDKYEPITIANINGELNYQGGSYVFPNGRGATWLVREFLNGEYRVYIETANLIAGTTYTINFTIDKAHYQNQSFTYQFVLQSVGIEIEAEIIPAKRLYTHNITEFQIAVRMYVTLNNGTNYINKGIIIEGLNVTYSIYNFETGEIVYNGSMTWDESYTWADGETGAYMATISTRHPVTGDPLSGFFFINITATPGTMVNIRVSHSVEEIIFVGYEVTIPAWFYILLTITIGAAVVMAGYSVKKALYLRIPFVLRKIDESIKKIEKDKFPAVGVMTGRNEFIINRIMDSLEDCDIEWEREGKIEVKKVAEAGKEAGPALTGEELKLELDNIPDLSADEKMLFLEELKRLNREAQEEFLKSLKSEISK